MCVIFPSSFMENCVHIYIHAYISSLSRSSLGSFIQQRATIFIIFRSSSSFSPSSHLCVVWTQISPLCYCFPWSLPLCSAIPPRLFFHPRHVCACVYVCVFGGYIDASCLMFHSLFFLDFPFSIPVAPFSCNLSCSLFRFRQKYNVWEIVLKAFLLKSILSIYIYYNDKYNLVYPKQMKRIFNSAKLTVFKNTINKVLISN